jgi:hypothetical protein
MLSLSLAASVCMIWLAAQRREAASAESTAVTRAGHVVFTTGRCPSCDPLRQVTETNAAKAWRDTPEVQFQRILPKDTKTNKYGVPVLKELFLHIMRQFPHASTYTYVNADILMDARGFLDTVNTVKVVGEFLMVGRRTNVQWNVHDSVDNASFDFNRKFEGGELFRIDAQDYFTVSPHAVDWQSFPAFVIGRPGYDNWLVDHVFHKETVWLIDATRTVRAIHQSDSDGDFSGLTRKMDEKDRQWNRDLGSSFDHGTTVFAKWTTLRCTDGFVALRPVSLV